MDTCAIIWDALEPEKISDKAKQAIEQANDKNELLISDISIWEIAMLISKERIKIETNAAHFINLFLQSRNISVIPISAEIAELSVNFDSPMSTDPADRLIAATSIAYQASLITADKKLLHSELIDTLW